MRLFAFWRYDLFPYVLGGYFNKMRDDGAVFVPNYNSWFNPIMFLPEEKGQEILDELMKLREEHRTAKEDVDKKFKELVKGLLPHVDHFKL